eukprot:70853-Chlamydomonas_euryale.AAC.6
MPPTARETLARTLSRMSTSSLYSRSRRNSSGSSSASGATAGNSTTSISRLHASGNPSTGPSVASAEPSASRREVSASPSPPASPPASPPRPRAALRPLLFGRGLPGGASDECAAASALDRDTGCDFPADLERPPRPGLLSRNFAYAARISASRNSNRMSARSRLARPASDPGSCSKLVATKTRSRSRCLHVAERSSATCVHIVSSPHALIWMAKGSPGPSDA